MKRLLLWLVLSLLAPFVPVFAHSASTSYLAIDPPLGREVAFTWRIALRDLDALLDLDVDGDGRLTWGEVDDRVPDILHLASGSLALSTSDTEEACTMSFDSPRWQHIDDAGLLVLSGRARCSAHAERVQLIYRLFAGVDPTHRALVSVPGATQPTSLAPDATLSLAASGGGATTGKVAAQSFGAMFADGVRHILGGFDHLLFLIALMLPAVVERRDSRWTARLDPRAALVQVAWIASAFTIAHSITLGLASFGVLRVPTLVIEPLIAVTVLAAALNNLWPIVTTRLAFAAFGFGLIHGFGFAEVLAPLGLPPLELARVLLAFNLGVEAGQLIVVALSFALLAQARNWRGYSRWILGGGSAVAALLASAWIIERVFDVAILPA
jgi:HupE / UreJ protein